MKVCVIAVGRPAPLLRDAIFEYERRAQRYMTLEVIEVRAEKALDGMPEDQVREIEGERILSRVPRGFDLVALTRAGEQWSSTTLSSYLQQIALQSQPGAAFMIGGAYGLSDAAVAQASRQICLSAMTLPHDLARLVLVEQLYRAGTITRNEPYHKARG